MNYQCVDCGSAMTVSGESISCTKCQKTYPLKNNVAIAWPTDMSDMAREEAEYHDHFIEDAGDVHQLNAFRNTYYHNLLWSYIRDIKKGSDLLEIGAGSGVDTRVFADDYKIVATDISPKTLERLDQNLKNSAVSYVACDGTQLPFVDESFAGVYMSAVWHHLEEYQRAIDGFARVLQSGGRLGIAVEPNSFYFLPMKFLRPLLCRATHTQEEEGSHADAEMTGFSYRQIKKMFDTNVWSEVEIRPMWFIAGFWHYILEFIYRAFKLKKRIVLPRWLDKLNVYLDEVLFKIPGVKHLCWHWVIVARKK